MNILNTLLGAGGESSNKSAGMLGAIMNLLGNRQTGGLMSLVQAFNAKGLGETVSSWIGTGENKPISPHEVQNALGTERIQQFAQEAGVPQQEAPSVLAQLLPNIVDKLTPEGRVPPDDKVENELSQLKNKFFG